MFHFYCHSSIELNLPSFFISFFVVLLFIDLFNSKLISVSSNPPSFLLWVLLRRLKTTEDLRVWGEVLLMPSVVYSCLGKFALARCFAFGAGPPARAQFMSLTCNIVWWIRLDGAEESRREQLFGKYVCSHSGRSPHPIIVSMSMWIRGVLVKEREKDLHLRVDRTRIIFNVKNTIPSFKWKKKNGIKKIFLWRIF